jgi:hypothetical protein
MDNRHEENRRRDGIEGIDLDSEREVGREALIGERGVAGERARNRWGESRIGEHQPTLPDVGRPSQNGDENVS